MNNERTTMLAYKNDPVFREKFLGLIRWHREQDAIASGTYGETDDSGKWRGCAVGCSLRSLDLLRGVEYDDRGEHARYEPELGIPRILARLQDHLFESLPAEQRLDWPLRFSTAIRCGADLSGVWPRFALWLLVDETDGVLRLAHMDRTRAAIRVVAALYERRLAGETVSRDEWLRARSEARYYADAAYYAAAAAADAADAADAAADTAAAYAYAYAYAADADARSKAIARQADKLVELLEAAPVL